MSILRDSPHYYADDHPKTALLFLRLVTLLILMSLLTVHLRSMRLFRWEVSVTGGMVVAYCVAELGLTLCAGVSKCHGPAIQAFLCGTGAALLAVNAGVIWQRWQKASQLTRVVAELLDVVGVQVKRQVITKVVLSAMAAVFFVIDLVFAYQLTHPKLTL